MTDQGAHDPAHDLAAVLRERASEVLARWLVQFERSPLRFRRATKAAAHAAQVANLVEALAEAASQGLAALQPGAQATRELERSAAFLGAAFASEGATGFDVAALLYELRDAVADVAAPADTAPLSRLFEWLTTVAQDAFAASGLQSLRERQAEQLEAGTPVIEVLPRVPAVLLVGAPSTELIDGLLSRGWMLAVGSAAPCLILDCAGLAEVGEKNFDGGYLSFLRQADGSALQIVLSGARRPLRERVIELTAAAGLSLQHFDRFDSAVAHALERAGYRLMGRG